MKRLLEQDALVIRFLNRTADLFVVNLLFVICSLPVLTLGASMTAMYRTLFALREERGRPAAVFFQSFRQNLRQATLIWLLFLTVFVLSGADIWLLYHWGALQSLPVLIVCIVTELAVMSLFIYAFPFLSMFECSTWRLLTNCFALSGGNIRVTLLSIAVTLLPFTMFFFATTAFLACSVVWLFIGFALGAYANVLMLEKVFSPYLAQQEKEGGRQEKF